MPRAHRWRVYLKIFDDSGNYQNNWIEVTDDVELDSLGTVDQSLDNTNYNIGIYRNSNFQVTFRNDSGRYSDVGQPESMFRFTRTNSLFKITWQGNSDRLECGFFQAGNTALAPEIEIFTGLLSDKSTTMDLQTQELQFDVLGRETVLTTVNVPVSAITFATQPVTISIATPGVITLNSLQFFWYDGLPFQLTTTGGLPNGLNPSQTYYAIAAAGGITTIEAASSPEDAFNNANPIVTSGSQSGTHTLAVFGGTDVASIIFNILNQPEITEVLNVSSGNINVGTTFTVDDTTPFIGVTVWSALSDLLLISNSVLYIKNGAIIVAPRVASTSVKYTFYGQSSQLGPENIQDIQNITNGIPRMFNSFSWTSNISSALPDYISQNVASIAIYGVSPQTLTQKFTYGQQFPLDSLVTEFGLPKQEFDLYTPMTYATLALFLLDKVSVDYPVVYVPGPNPLPICGSAICGQAITPKGIWSFTESPTNYYKIEGTSIDPQTNLICISMRRV